MEISNAENINQVKSILKSAQRVLILTGAGISAESGVPTFRGGGGAPIWRGMPFEQLSSAEMVEKDLPLVWEWFDYRRGKVSECEPNAAHKTLAKVQHSNQFEEFVIVTQNIDGLHQAAGAKSVIELHGSIWQARCLSCKTKQDLRDIPADERPPVCPECFDSMRPDVILFGEAMPMQAVYEAQQKAEKADVCFVIGTSALVYPAAELPLIAKQNGAKIIEINPEETTLSAQADVSLRGKAGDILPLIFAEDNSSNSRLPDNEAIKSSVEQIKKENQGERKKESMPAANLNRNDQHSKGNFMTSETHPLRVDFIVSEEFPILNKLGMTFAPGKKQSGAVSGNWNRDLASDLTRLREFYQADTLVSLVEDEEVGALGIGNFEYECRNHVIELIRFPLKDISVPTSLIEYARLIREIIKRLNNNKTVVIHCKGGLGRAGMTTACAMVAASGNKTSGPEAIKMVRAARKNTVETSEQERFVSLFSEYWKLYIQQITDLLRQQKTAVKEKVLEIGCEGGGAELYRFKTRDGKWLFCTEGSSISIVENDLDETISWETEPVESISEGIDSFKLAEQIFIFHPLFIHPEHRAEVKRYLEYLHAQMSDEKREHLHQFAEHSSITPDQWLAIADREMTWRAERDNLDNSGRGKSSEDYEEKIPPLEELSDNHFLLCWKERSVLDAKNSPHPLDVVSSRQLNRVKAGDTIWIVFVNQHGELILAGRLKAAEVVDYLTAVRRLHDANLWDGEYYALAKENTAEKINLINLGQKALELRFKKSGSDRLIATNGKIKAQQLGSMRELTLESAQMLSGIWENAIFDFDEGNFDDINAFDDEVNFDKLDESIESEDLVRLLEHFRQLVCDEPYNAEAHFNLGVAAGENGLLEEENAAYRKTIELDPDCLAAYYNLGCNYLRSGELDKSEQSFKAAIRLAPEYAPTRFMLGVVYAEMRDYEKAIAVTKEGLEHDPDSPTAYFNIGNSYFHLQDYEKAARWFEKSAEKESTAPNTFYMLGKCHRHLGEKQKEFDAYRKAIENDPDFLDALFALGTVYAHLTKTAEGKRVTYFETGANQLEIEFVRFLYFYMGLASLVLGNLNEARERQAGLRKVDGRLANELQFFIDRSMVNDDFKDDFDEFGEEYDPAELLKHCRRHVSDQPESGRAHYNLGDAFDKNELPEEAKVAYLKAIELDPNYTPAYSRLGEYYLRAGELDKAEQTFKSKIRLTPEFAPARFGLGVVYAEMGDFEKAIAVTKEGLENDLDNLYEPMTHFNVGDFYIRLPDYEKAVRWFEQSSELAPDDRETFYRLGECYRHLGEKQKEFDAYWRVLELSPDFNAFGMFALGTAYAHLTGTAEGERVAYFETYHFNSADPQALFHLSLGYLGLGRIERDLGRIEHARELQVDLQEMDEHLADQLQFFINRFEEESPQDGRKDEGNNWAELLESLRQLVREEPLDADAHYNLGVACDENDLPEEANGAYRKAIELDPDYLGAFYNLGCNYLRANKLDESEQAFKTAISLVPEFAPARFMLGVVYGGLGDFEKAISTTKEGLQQAPDDPMAYFNIGNFYSHLRDYKKASEWFEKSAEIDPNAPDTFYRLGKCYRESGEKEKEFDAYLNAVELAPDFVDALFALGTVYAHLTDTDEGKQVPYFETGGDLVLSDPRVSFYLGLGNLALGNVDIAQDSQDDLRKMDERIADQLQFFIDRFDSENKNADDIFIDDIFIDNIPNSAELLKEKRKSFKVKVSETIIEAQNTPELYRQVMTLLFDRGLLQNAHLPFATSSTRYLIAKEPIHPSGKNFFKFVEYAGFYMETNKSRHDAVSHLKKFVETLQVEFENLEDGIPIRVTPLSKKQNTQPTVEQRFLGSLLGLAVGDALGTTVEFKPTGTFPKVTTIIGGGPFELNAGEWTDDTSMALCLAESLIELNEFDAFDQMRRYCRWKNEGYLSSNGVAFDIGNTVRRALEKFEQQTGVDELNAYCGSIGPATAGNGSLMRLAPVPLFFANEREKAIQYAGESSRTTHGARECVDACRYFAALIIGVIQGRAKEEILSARFTPLPGLWDVEPLAAKVAEVAEGSFKSPRPPEITGAVQGYVIPSLQAALWAFYHTDNFADGALKVVNLGYDADTYGAIYGQIAGAYYGAQLIPEEWLNLIAKRDLIESMAENLYKANEQRLITRN